MRQGIFCSVVTPTVTEVKGLEIRSNIAEVPVAEIVAVEGQAFVPQVDGSPPVAAVPADPNADPPVAAQPAVPAVPWAPAVPEVVAVEGCAARIDIEETHRVEYHIFGADGRVISTARGILTEENLPGMSEMSRSELLVAALALAKSTAPPA